MFSLPSFHRPSEDRDHGRQWGVSFLREWPQNFLEGADHRALPLAPTKHLHPVMFCYAGPSPWGALLTPLHLGVLRRGIGGQMGMGQAPLFICICILKLSQDLLRQAVAELPPAPHRIFLLI